MTPLEQKQATASRLRRQIADDQSYIDEWTTAQAAEVPGSKEHNRLQGDIDFKRSGIEANTKALAGLDAAIQRLQSGGQAPQPVDDDE